MAVQTSVHAYLALPADQVEFFSTNHYVFSMKKRIICFFKKVLKTTWIRNLLTLLHVPTVLSLKKVSVLFFSFDSDIL
jgi:hypothetical protein